LSDFSKPVLAFDSALGGCIAAVLNPATGLSFVRTIATEREQAAKLVPMIQDVMAEAGLKPADLGLIATTIGPGSFTGLRISLSTARAMGLALGIPVQGVGTFEVMMRSCKPKKDCLVVLESKRTDFYVQSFDASGKAGEAVCLDAGSIIPLAQNKIICGDALERLRDETGESFSGAIERYLLDPVILAQTGLDIFRQNGGKAEKPEPLYMREADVSISTKTQREIRNLPQ